MTQSRSEAMAGVRAYMAVMFAQGLAKPTPVPDHQPSSISLPIRQAAALLGKKITIVGGDVVRFSDEPFSQSLPKGMTEQLVAEMVSHQTNLITMASRVANAIRIRQQFTLAVRKLQQEVA